ncbi:carboxylesterase/lipase family protein [Pseudonocardia humida]|uniref:Carboxylic ester hydrolase n=1 Tax=Pseudonocardia humida TaxID=2800819 RepID=A0ABT0ZTU3_9PSEU|nr:carboxylesterase family protein [Pseudonocardia humida]MCO1654143.1 carboxylesterase/lipase family protein [Pseudonocardia humida]
MVLVLTGEGAVAGVVDRGAVRFRGIPYAAAPYGARRFLPPMPVERWEGVRDTSEFGPGSPQGRFEGDPFDAYFNPHVQGEDSLTLDVWTPDPATAGLPVMVWIHGGGFITGTGSAPAHDGRTFARDGIVHVGVNYRLGVDGFAFFGDGTENLGLRDQIAALEWVRRNIEHFGGDPSNVTVFGQSAGAVAILELLAMPAARGLFARAIAMSGSPVVATDAAGAARVTARLAERYGVAPEREAFAGLSLERTLAEIIPMALEFVDPSQWGVDAFTVSPYRGVCGTASMPESPMAAARTSTVPLMTGTVRNETTGFLAGLGLLETLPDERAEQMLALLGVDDDIRQAYTAGPRRLRTGAQLVEAAWTDWLFRVPTLELVERRTAPTHVYEFHWESPSFPEGFGANHALEVPFIRDDLAGLAAVGPAGLALLGPDAPQQLATSMHDAFAAFAKNGDPGWAPYGPTDRTTMVFDTVSTVQNDPAAMARKAWEGKR